MRKEKERKEMEMEMEKRKFPRTKMTILVLKTVMTIVPKLTILNLYIMCVISPLKITENMTDSHRIMKARDRC